MHHHHLTLRAKLIIMLSVMASLFLVALDQTIVSTALGKIVEDLNAYSSLSWIVTAYLLTTTVTVPIAGKLSDLFGRRILLLSGVALFAVSSLLCGLSGDINHLILWRAVQGIGSGIITANAFTIIGDLFEARERGRWQGLFGAVFGISSVIGPLLGGWLTDSHSLFGLVTTWHWIFWLNVPIAVVAFTLITIFCPPLKHAHEPKVDYLGAGLLTLGLATLVLAVDNTKEIFHGFLTRSGWSLANLRMAMAATVIVSLGLFVWRQMKAAEPIMPLRFFKNRNFSLLMGVATLFGAGFMGSIIYLTQFNQQVFGASPTKSGLMLVPMVVGIMSASISSGQFISKRGKYKAFMQIGIILATAMVGMLATLNPESSYLQEAIYMVLLGIGLGFVMPVMNIAVQNEFSQKDLGVATSAIQLFRGLGSTIGIAVFGAMLTSGLTSHIGNADNSAYIRSLKNNPVVTQKFSDLNDTNTLLTLNMPDVRQTIRKSTVQAINQGPATEAEKSKQNSQFIASQNEYTQLVTHAFSESLQRIFTIAAIIMAAAIGLVFATRERELKASEAHITPGEL